MDLLCDVGDRDFPWAQALQPLKSYMHEVALQSHRIKAYQLFLLTHKATPGSRSSPLSKEVWGSSHITLQSGVHFRGARVWGEHKDKVPV